MAIKSSSGLRNKLLTNTGLASAMDLGFVNIYSGTAPATADDAATGMLLCVVSNNSGGTGIKFASSAGAGTLSKDASEVWSGVNLATGIAGYYRHVAPGDTAAASTTEARLQGVIGTAGADMNMTAIDLVSGATQTLDFYTVNLPSL